MTIGAPEESSNDPAFLFLTAYWLSQITNARSFHSSIGLWMEQRKLLLLFSGPNPCFRKVTSLPSTGKLKYD